MADLKRKIYVVTDVATEVTHLVKAKTRAGAIAHVVRKTFKAEVATQDQLMALAKTAELEEAE
jgi:hypothetical protein